MTAGYNKYGISPKEQRTFEGTVYASKAEKQRATELYFALRAGEIRRLIEQPRFALGCPENVYVADFWCENWNGIAWVEDVKGYPTAKFKRDVKLWRRYGSFTLHVLTRRRGGWDRKIILGGTAETKTVRKQP